jgi:hypothetical protein
MYSSSLLQLGVVISLYVKIAVETLTLSTLQDEKFVYPVALMGLVCVFLFALV